MKAVLSASRTILSLSISIASFLIAQSIASALDKPTSLFGRFDRAQRENVNHVVIHTSYSQEEYGEYSFSIKTRLLFGSTNTNITLVITARPITWVPRYPSLPSDFCSLEKNEEACIIAGRFGHYQAEKVNTSRKFSAEEVYWSQDSNKTQAKGFWIDDTITIDGVPLPLTFGVAEDWHIPPLLGLGIMPNDGIAKIWVSDPDYDYDYDVSSFEKRKYPGLIGTLHRQGRIMEPLCSFYSIMDTKSDGEILFGGVDTDKFYGKLDIWDQAPYPGWIPDTPIARISNSEFTGVSNPIDIGSRIGVWVIAELQYIWLPEPLHEELVRSLQPLGLERQTDVEEEAWSMPCTIAIPDYYFLELTFNQSIIKIPFSDLFSSKDIPDARGRCPGLFRIVNEFPNEIGPPHFAYILGRPFFNAAYVVMSISTNLTAIAASKPNVKTQSIVEIGSGVGNRLSEVSGSPRPVTTDNSSSRDLPSPRPSPSREEPPIGIIIGASISGTVVLILVILGSIYMFRLIQKNKKKSAAKFSDLEVDIARRPN